MLLDRVEQGDRLQAVARGSRPGLLNRATGVDRVLDVGDDQALAELGEPTVAEFEHLGEVMPGVDVHDREGKACGAKRLLGQPQEHDRVLAAAEQEHWPLQLRGHLSEYVDRLGLERLDVRELIAHT